MTRNRVLLCVLSGLIMTLASTSTGHAAKKAKTLTLVRDGKPSCVIVLGSEASPSEQRGAQELQAHLKQMSGAELPIISDRSSPIKSRCGDAPSWWGAAGTPMDYV